MNIPTSPGGRLSLDDASLSATRTERRSPVAGSDVHRHVARRVRASADAAREPARSLVGVAGVAPGGRRRRRRGCSAAARCVRIRLRPSRRPATATAAAAASGAGAGTVTASGPSPPSSSATHPSTPVVSPTDLPVAPRVPRPSRPGHAPASADVRGAAPVPFLQPAVHDRRERLQEVQARVRELVVRGRAWARMRRNRLGRWSAARRPARSPLATVAPRASRADRCVRRRREACFSAAEQAQPLMKQRKLRAARRYLQVCAREECPRAARTDCRNWLADVTRAEPTLVFVAREERPDGESSAVEDVRVSVDGEVIVPARLDGRRAGARSGRAHARPSSTPASIRSSSGSTCARASGIGRSTSCSVRAADTR